MNIVVTFEPSRSDPKGVVRTMVPYQGEGDPPLDTVAKIVLMAVEAEGVATPSPHTADYALTLVGPVDYALPLVGPGVEYRMDYHPHVANRGGPPFEPALR